MTDTEKIAALEKELKESNEKFTQLQADSTKAITDLESVRSEAAGYRVMRNQALRETAALTKVVKAHNITFDVGSADLKGLSIEDGKVSGEFEYTATKATTQVPGTQGIKGDEITPESIKGMTPEQINANWDKVSAVLAA